MNVEATETRALADIIIGERVRHDLGDLASLAESIQRQGLFHPIVVMTDGTLVAGQRRLEAARLIGWERIPVTVVDVADMLSAERDENQERKDFTPTEAVAIGRLIEDRHRPIAKEAQRQNMARATAIRMGTGETPPSIKVGESRDIASAAVGMSAWTYHRAKAVVEAAEAEPEIHGDLPARMDETGNVLGAHREMERRKGKPTRHEIHARTRHLDETRALERFTHALEGLVLGVVGIDFKQADPAKIPDLAGRIREALSSLRKTERTLTAVAERKTA